MWIATEAKHPEKIKRFIYVIKKKGRIGGAFFVIMLQEKSSGFVSNRI